LSLQYSNTDGYDSDIAPEVKEWAARELPYFLQFPDVLVDLSTGSMKVSDYVAQWVANTAGTFRSEGLSLKGMRQHKVAFFTRYSFGSGPLKGLYVGGGHRYQSRIVLGTLPDFSIVYGNSRWYSDLLLGYQVRKFAFLKHGVRLQLNVNNLFDRTVPTQTGAFIDKDGVAHLDYRVRLVEPRRWRLSASFEF
ncbi:MAG: TonB-dependent receptor, partial [Opitutae bacterium]|nr:TonB-dependent receptor [Opitutae bacterium]